MFKKLIQKILGTEMVEVTYRVTDVSPHTSDHLEPYIMTIKIAKKGSAPVTNRLPSYGHWADIEIISIKDI